jgi:PBSX family phage terminase large subunit
LSYQTPPEIKIDISLDVFLRCYKHAIPPQLLVNERGELVESIAKIIGPEPDIDFLWGGRDSGKTRHIAMRLIVDCLTLPYFRCILVRKVFNTIHDSQWQQIKDIATEWGVDHLFTFKESPLEINCVNGNKFICRGMDDPSKLKSVSNPSHCWVEEGNQLDRNDFIVIMTSLRTNSARVKTWVSFNPECDGDYKEFWLFEMFFAPNENRMYGLINGYWEHTIPAIPGAVGIHAKERKVFFTYRCTWTTYRDNRYCRPERIAFLLNMASLDSYYETVFTNGLWGNRKVDDPYCYCFDEQIHPRINQIDKRLELILSFDFNVNPITCGVYQHLGDEIRCLESIKLSNSNIYELCGYIKIHYNGYMFLVTGDATGRNTNALVKDDLNYYTVIKQELNLSIAQIKVPSINPPITENRVLVNAVLKKMKVSMHPEKCKHLIYDCKNVSVDDLGKIDKGDRNNPKKRADHLDHFRYYLNTFHKSVLKML